MLIRGWVYVIVNKAMPGLVKVGFSTKDPVLRARELDNTGAPHEYEVLYDALVEQPRDVEASVHTLLHVHREGREWFRCRADDAVRAIQQSAKLIFSERRSPTVPDAQESDSLHLAAEVCGYAECKHPVARTYKGRALCAEHYEVERRSRFHMARSMARKG